MNLIRFDYNEDRLRKIPCFLEECLLTGDLVKIGGLQDFTYIFSVISQPQMWVRDCKKS